MQIYLLDIYLMLNLAQIPLWIVWVVGGKREQRRRRRRAVRVERTVQRRLQLRRERRGRRPGRGLPRGGGEAVLREAVVPARTVHHRRAQAGRQVPGYDLRHR